MKMKIIKFLIKKDGFYDRERLMVLSERTLRSIFICKIYRSFLKALCREGKVEIKKEKHPMELISEHLGCINTFSKIKLKFLKKYGK